MEKFTKSHRVLPCGALVKATTVGAALLLVGITALAEQNLLKNPGFEQSASAMETPPGWNTRADSAGKVTITEKDVHSGRQGITIPANTAVEQNVTSAPAGAYLARCWVKSDAEQPVTLLLQDPDQPWSAYTLKEVKVPGQKWVQLEVFCALDYPGNLSLTVGGMSQQFRLYHGNSAVMNSAIVADDFELIRVEHNNSSELGRVAVWDGNKDLGPTLDWRAKSEWRAVQNPGQTLVGTPVVQAGPLAGAVRKADGGLVVYAIQPGGLKLRCVLIPTSAIPSPKCSMIQAGGRAGIRVSSETGDHAYTAWLTTNGIISIEAKQVGSFKVENCRLRYGLLPSFVGTDVLYSPAKLTGNQVNIPSTEWLVGLVDGSASIMTAVWESDSQAVSLGLAGEGEKRLIDSFSISTATNGFSLSFIEHADIWHREPLNEDWLGEYTPIQWQPPFPARWMGQFFVSSGGRPNFRAPYLDYSFPIANAKTRMWGVWFEDWNHYPFYFDGSRTVLHFEKTFVPKGDALFYFLEPAAADLLSPVDIVEQVLGPEKSSELLDSNANGLRKLKYSTPDQFMYDRPVCATTTRLSKIKNDERSTVGRELATHLYEFIRGIRARVDQYVAYFDEVGSFLASERTAHPELREYIAELEAMIDEGKGKSKEIYATPLAEVQRKTDGIKKRLQESGGDGFDCAELDVRSPAGAQDDLCRRYNRLVMRLTQTAALNCGDSPAKAAVAQYVWQQSRKVLRQPTRWEPRRTLYFFEP